MLEIVYKFRSHKVVGERSHRLTIVIEVMGVEISTFTSEPYVKNHDDVRMEADTFLENLRTALGLYGLNTKVTRKEF